MVYLKLILVFYQFTQTLIHKRTRILKYCYVVLKNTRILNSLTFEWNFLEL